MLVTSAEVALIHRNFTGCQAGLTGLCHGSDAEESDPVRETGGRRDIRLFSLASKRGATESQMNLDVVALTHAHLPTYVSPSDLTIDGRPMRVSPQRLFHRRRRRSMPADRGF